MSEDKKVGVSIPKIQHFTLIEIIVYFQFNQFSSQDVKGSETEHINLKVLGQDNAIVQFKIKKHTPLRKLMTAYCDRVVSVVMDVLRCFENVGLDIGSRCAINL